MLLLYVFFLFVDPPQTSTPLDLRGEFVKMTSLVEEMDPLQFRGGIHIATRVFKTHLLITRQLAPSNPRLFQQVWVVVVQEVSVNVT